MKNYRNRLPSLSALAAFECSARLCNFSRAAEELFTSQPAISRHISGLEEFLGTSLFDRKLNRLVLTGDGRRLYQAVVIGLDTISGAVEEIHRNPREKTVKIACTDNVAHLWLLPRYEILQDYLGADTEIQLVSSDYEYHQILLNEGADICLTFVSPIPENFDRVLLFEEEIFPVCSPKFAEEHRILFSEENYESVYNLPFLRLNKMNFGWATWDQWFMKLGVSLPEKVQFRNYSNYVFLLEAAVNGAGLALGWKGLTDRYIEKGKLVIPVDKRVITGGGFQAILGPNKDNRPLIEKTINFLKNN